MVKTIAYTPTRQVLAPGVVAAMGVIAAMSGCSMGQSIGQKGDQSIPPAIEAAPAVELYTEVKEQPADNLLVQPDIKYAAEVKPNYPKSHTVVRGDTLWDISERFLKSPWLWPQIWEYNPDIENPHLIYPGDRIALEYVEGQPRMVVSRNGKRLSQGGVGTNATGGNRVKPAPIPAGVSKVERLSPRIRVESLQDAIPTIPADAIQQFLAYPRVVSASEIKRAPYVIGNYDGRLASAAGHQIYVRGNRPAGDGTFGIFRENKPLRDPVTSEILGYEVTHVSTARLIEEGDPATYLIVDNKMETLSGDRLLSTQHQDVTHMYTPRTPKMAGEGRIISLVDAISQSGRNQIVVLNLGDQAGVQVGDIMAIERRGGTILDTYHPAGLQELNLPSTRTGVLMVFQTFDKVAYALVMESTRPIHINDIITDI